MAYSLDDYNDVKSRMAELKEKHPEGSLRPADLEHPYRIETIGDQTFIVYVAACFRSPDDPCPGIGAAWEPFPGQTNWTRDSELQNAETSAWGRAIMAALVADSSKGIASRDEIRNRQRDQDFAPPPIPYDVDEELIAEVKATVQTLPPERKQGFMDWAVGEAFPTPWPVEACTAMLAELARLIAADAVDLAATPCALCGATRSRRVLGAGNQVRCSETKDCEDRQAKKVAEAKAMAEASDAPFVETTT